MRRFVQRNNPVARIERSEIPSALLAALSVMDLEHVVGVDDDIDVFDATEVQWAIATRVQGDKEARSRLRCDLDRSASDLGIHRVAVDDDLCGQQEAARRQPAGDVEMKACIRGD